MGATGTYVRAGLPEVAAALSVLTGERHPLAPQEPGTSAVASSGSQARRKAQK
jgi:hypothetical protein